MGCMLIDPMRISSLSDMKMHLREFWVHYKAIGDHKDCLSLIERMLIYKRYDTHLYEGGVFHKGFHKLEVKLTSNSEQNVDTMFSSLCLIQRVNDGTPFGFLPATGGFVAAVR